MRTDPKLSQYSEYDRDAGKVLTLIVNVDQSIAENRSHGFEVPVNAKLRDIDSRIKDKSELEQFVRCADLARRLIYSYRPSSKSLVLFIQANGNVSTRELNVPLDTEARWADLPHIQPLVEAGDEFEELLIVLLDGRRSRFLTSFLGNITEHPEVLNPYPTSHTQTPGNDQTKSQPSFHRKADEREHHYLKSVSETTEAIASTRSINRIVLCGNDGASHGLYALLPKALQRNVISFVVLSDKATLEEIAGVITNPRYRAERNDEVAKVQSLLDRVGKRDRAITGVSGTLEALAEGRVHELIYAQGISLRGARCKNCGVITVDQPICPKCMSTLDTAEDAMDMVISAALDTGATIEQVRGIAAENLKASGGIGAFLRY
jgi:RNA polymerase subunit RPABC4/transcription elongation factor Spt4